MPNKALVLQPKHIDRRFCRYITLENLLELGLQSIVEDYLYIIKNKTVLSPFTSASDEEVYKMGTHLGGIISDLVLAATGATKLFKNLSKTKHGKKLVVTQQIVSTLKSQNIST